MSSRGRAQESHDESKKSEKVKMVVYGNKPVLDTREHAVCFVVVSKDFGVDLTL